MPGPPAFIDECQHHGTSAAELETQEKKGFDTGLRVRHPVIEGAELPVLIANFIVMEYGTGAIFGCPAHDQRDLEFARAYGLPVIPVVLPPDADAEELRHRRRGLYRRRHADQFGLSRRAQRRGRQGEDRRCISPRRR